MFTERLVTAEEFNRDVERRCELMKSVLQSKGSEYATNADRMRNFNNAGRMDNESPERALWGMLKKHLVSIRDLIDWVETNPEKINNALIDEKIGDGINYLTLLESMLHRFADEKLVAKI